MDRTPSSLLRQGVYSLAWVKDFYDRTSAWWGPNTDHAAYTARASEVERLAGPGRKRILDLGSGPGGNAAAMADLGNDVAAVEFSDRARHAIELARAPRAGRLDVVQADFYTVQLEGRFDVVCCWEVFGIGSDADQRRLLGRIAGEWLAPGGCVLMDVYNPSRPARAAGKEARLDPLPGVPGSVAMIERCHFDPVHSRWTDEWVPVADPSAGLAQTLRCYSPADLLLLLEGTGLALDRLEVDGREVTLDDRITVAGPLLEAWQYVVKLRAAGPLDITLVAILLAGVSALLYGGADFYGGLATRRSPVSAVLVFSQLVGLVLALVGVVVLRTPPPRPADLLWGAAAGVCGAAGLAALYTAIATTVVAVASPVAAVVGAVIPVAIGVAAGERPGSLAWVGIAAALPAVALLSLGPRSDAGAVSVRRAVALGAGAGLGFGLFFVAIARTAPDSGLWPLVAARVSTIALVTLAAAVGGRTLRPSAGSLAAVLATGALDMGANIAFLLASRTGLLSITAAVAALYPGPTVVLARLVLRERLTALRIAGLVLALAGVALISAA